MTSADIHHSGVPRLTDKQDTAPAESVSVGPPRHGRVARTIRRALRIVITVHALDAFAQAVLAGGFLNGYYGLLGLHRYNAILGVVILGYLQLAVAILYWRPGRGRGWPALACLGISAAESLQIVFGFERMLSVHVPLGVAIVMIMTIMTIWVWRPTLAQVEGDVAGRPT